MTSLTSIDRIPALFRAELASVTGEPAGAFRDDVQLGDVGLDSLALIEVLMRFREQILRNIGMSVDELSDPPPLPWLETVGELIAFVRSSVPATIHEVCDEDHEQLHGPRRGAEQPIVT